MRFQKLEVGTGECPAVPITVSSAGLINAAPRAKFLTPPVKDTDRFSEDFVREGRVIDGARHDEGSDEA